MPGNYFPVNPSRMTSESVERPFARILATLAFCFVTTCFAYSLGRQQGESSATSQSMVQAPVTIHRSVDDSNWRPGNNTAEASDLDDAAAPGSPRVPTPEKHAAAPAAR